MRYKENINNIAFNKPRPIFHIILNPCLVRLVTPILLRSLKTSTIKNDVSNIIAIIIIKPFCVEGSMTNRMKCSD